jgi:hypothetical protein
MNEATIQAKVRLAASAAGWRLWRNNVGTLLDSRGVPVRFGLANDSKQVNKSVKSGDLIGIRPVVITQDMVGRVIGQFVSIECKREGWKPSMTDEHELAQARWAEIVLLHGGYARFSTGDL